eukprot:669791-Rhodomonas_salina.2
MKKSFAKKEAFETLRPHAALTPGTRCTRSCKCVWDFCSGIPTAKVERSGHVATHCYKRQRSKKYRKKYPYLEPLFLRTPRKSFTKTKELLGEMRCFRIQKPLSQSFLTKP